MKPFFSLIIPVYNVERYLSRCVDSLLEQTYKDFEIILVDDGSKDSSPQICDKYGKKDGRVHVFHKQNGGASSARNLGLEKSDGKYVIFFDSDDDFDSRDSLQSIYDLVIKCNYDIVLYSCNQISGKTGKKELAYRIFESDIFVDKSKNEIINILYKEYALPPAAWCMSVKRDVLLANDILFPEGVTAEDFYWIIKILKFCDSIGGTNKAIYNHYCDVDNSVTSKARASGLAGILLTVNLWLSVDKWAQGVNEYVANMCIISILNYANLPKSERKDAEKIVQNSIIGLTKSNRLSIKIIRLFLLVFGLEYTSCIIKILHKILR